MTREEQLTKLQKLQAYNILEVRNIADLDSMGVILKHIKTGARITLLINDDDNKVFYIGFRTPPTDSTGVAHIIEHSVLCGSRKYPVKDPFIELAKGSLNTFLNAMTFPDKTVYPVASCNDKDFANLTDVYLDAVFHPNIYNEEKIFRQEGWHYELEDADSELKINGVVYNEMKGAFSSPDDVVEREILNSLFPHTPYGVESGGHPDNIPDLTYEAFLDFHRRYYHPSNSYIYLYGNCDMAERLEYIDSEYLSEYDALDIDSSIASEPAFKKAEYVTREYPVPEGSSGEGQSYLTYNVVTGTDNLNPEEYIAFEVLEYALASTPGSPIKKALIDAGIGRDVYAEYSNGTAQPFFSFISRETDPDRLDEFVRIIEDTLKAQTEGGLDHNTLYAAINLFEFKYREADYGSYPKGLMTGLKMLDSWLYDDRQPFIHVISNDVYSRLKDYVHQGYFEGLIRDRLLDNSHKVILSVVPKPGLTTEHDRELSVRLQQYRDSLSSDEKDKLVLETKALAEYQESEDSPEALSTIPLLTREDLRKEAEKFIYERADIDGIETVFHDIFTNGIGYLQFMFRLDDIPADYWSYVGLLKNLMGLMDTGDLTYPELFTQISLNTGGIVPAVDTFIDASDTSKYSICYVLDAKALDSKEKLEKAIYLMEQMCLFTKYEDKQRLHEIVDEALSNIKAGMTSAGHSVAAAAAMSQISELDATMGQMSGIPFLRMLERLDRDYDAVIDETIDKLKELTVMIFRPENLLVDYTGSREALKRIEGRIADFRDRLNNAEYVKKKPGKAVPVRKTTGYTTAAQVQYVARCGNFKDAGFEFTGGLRVLKVIMGYDYLWTQVRVRGGAYGCMCAFTRSGKGQFVSYRDPNLERTVEVFEQASDYVRNFDADERTMTQYVIGTIADLDVPKTPKAKGMYGRSAYMSKATMDIFQKERDEVLATTPDRIRELAPYIDAIMEADAFCVVGCEDRIKERAEDFDHIEPLFDER